MQMKTPMLAALLAGSMLAPVVALAAGPALDGDDIGGVVKSAKGPEAGVWVIAETKALPTGFARMVVTDEEGRFVIPDLPKGKYKLWVRGYGLVDSKPVDAALGQTVDLTAIVAPSPKAAAEVYPAAWWYSMVKPPPQSDFPGTGAKDKGGNGISPGMLTQQHWLINQKEQCMYCHQLGDKATRELEAADQIEGWKQRIQMARPDHEGKSAPNAAMIRNMTRFGSRGIEMFADWTTRIQKGEVPAAAPPRPQGFERNIVVTVQEWTDGDLVHDLISSDHRDPSVNAGGKVYGMSTHTGMFRIFDTKTNEVTSMPIPSVTGGVHNAKSAIHADEMDGKGRVWMATVAREGADAAWCRDGSVASSKYFPLPPYKAGGAILPVYDPKTSKITTIPLCVGGNHGNFTYDKDSTFYLSGDYDAIGWINTRVWDETQDPKKSTGWCPMVLDTNGDGKIDPDWRNWNVRNSDMTGGGENAEVAAAAANKPQALDPTKDTRIRAYLYNMGVGKDGIVWQGAYNPNMPSAIIRLDPGKHPPETCKTEIYEPPMKDGKYLFYGIRGVNVDADGVAWAAPSSGQVASFDRRKCKVLNGPTATGQQCPEGWTVYDLPAPKLGNTSATTDLVYNEWNDYVGVMGLGENAKFFPAVNSDSILAMSSKLDRWTVFRVPYPLGFYTRGLDFRIDDPKAGWKGRAMRATYASGTPWHQEDGETSGAKLVTFQVRPDPLAH